MATAPRRTLAWLLVIAVTLFLLRGLSRFFSLYSTVAAPLPPPHVMERPPVDIGSAVTLPRSIAQTVPTAADSNSRERMAVQSAVKDTNKAGVVGTDQTPTLAPQPSPTNHPTIRTGLDNAAKTAKSVEEALHPSETTRTTTTTTTDPPQLHHATQPPTDKVYLPLAPWEQASMDQRECTALPPGTPSYCCIGSLSSRARVNFEPQKCRKDESVYRRNEQLSLDSLQPLASSSSTSKDQQCDVCRIMDVLARYNKTWGLVGDSIAGQSFFGLECELRRRGRYNVTMLDVDYRLERPERFWYHLYGLNKIHELHVTPIPNVQNEPAPTVIIRYYVMYRPPPDVSEILHNNDVILFDFGLHYGEFYTKPQSASDFERDMTQFVSAVAEEKRLHPWKLMAWRESSAQHFDRPNGEFDSGLRDKTCVATNVHYNDTGNLTTRRQVMERVFESLNATDQVAIVPFWNYSRQFHELHAESGGDCAHYCSTPSFWLYLWREWRRALDSAVNQWDGHQEKRIAIQ
jgi:hypothetical protein